MLSRLSSSTAVGLLLATAFAAAQTPALPAAQTDTVAAPEVTFRTEVNYVEEDVRVVDRQGNFVKGLKREDFQLAEDNKPQKINTFGMVDIALTPVQKPLFAGRDALPIEPDIASNEQVLDGRLYLILLDDYHVAPLRSQNARNLARRFVLEKLGANDQAAVVTTSGLAKSSQDFTQNRHLLVQAIDNFVGQKLPSATLNKVDQRAREMADQQSSDAGVQPITPQNMATEDMDAPERMFKARAALNSLRSIAEWMSAIQGRRKAIVYISEGVDYNLYDMFTGADPSQFNFENFNMVQQETWDTIAAASRSNVQIYPIDPRGLTTMAQENIEIQGLPLLALHLGPETLAQELQTSQMNLRQRHGQGVRPHRPGEQFVLRPRVLLHEREARRQAAKDRSEGKRLSGGADYLSQALRGAAREAQDHIRQAGGPRSGTHRGVDGDHREPSAEDRAAAPHHGDSSQRARQDDGRRGARRDLRQGADVCSEQRDVQ